MFTKVIATACLLTLAKAAYQGPLAGGQPAALYPAGLDPRSCPDFPICTNPYASAQPYQSSASYQPRPRFQPEKPVYEPRYTDTPVVQPQRYSVPEYHFVPRTAKFAPRRPVSRYTPPQRYESPRQYVPPQQFSPQQQFIPTQQYSGNPRVREYTPEQKRALDRGEYIGDGDYHGEGLAEALAPEYLGQQQSQRASAPAVQANTPGYQKVSAFLAQSQNLRQPPAANACRNRGLC